jgi:hypothetical protein
MNLVTVSTVCLLAILTAGCSPMSMCGPARLGVKWPVRTKLAGSSTNHSFVDAQVLGLRVKRVVFVTVGGCTRPLASSDRGSPRYRSSEAL